MKLPNGYGSVVKLTGHRRNPFMVRKTSGYDSRGYPVYQIIGYTATRADGLQLLAKYNSGPWDTASGKMTLKDLYSLWREKRLPRLGTSNGACMSCAYRYLANLEDRPYRTITVFQMQDCIDGCGKGPATQAHIRNLWKHLDRMAYDLEIIHRKNSEHLETDPMPESEREPFTPEEVQLLWDHVEEPFTDVPLILLYSGWRKTELLTLRAGNVNLARRTMKGGIKTASGIGRVVPIHSAILPLVEKRLQDGGPFLLMDHGKPFSTRTFDRRWTARMQTLGLHHVVHETRHTFETVLDRRSGNRRCIDLLMGHRSRDVGNRVYNHKTLQELRETVELLSFDPLDSLDPLDFLDF